MRYRFAGLTILGTLGLGACSPSAPVPSKISDGWTGLYAGGDIHAVITRRSNGVYRFDISVSRNTPHCTGAGENGDATLSPDGQILTADFDAPGHAECEIDLKHQGRALVAKETEECGELHEAQCSFSGTLLPVD